MGINTVKLGDALEERVYNVLKHYLESEQLFIPGNRSKIFGKKKYFSRDRQDDIIFDIAIETYRQNASEYALLTLIEVKNYSGSIPVNDIEEFESKIRQEGCLHWRGIASLFQ